MLLPVELWQRSQHAPDVFVCLLIGNTFETGVFCFISFDQVGEKQAPLLLRF